MKIKIQKLSSKAILPTQGSAAAAGWDLYSTIDVCIGPGESVVIPTDLALEIPDGHFGAIYPRSGLAIKKGLRLCNCTAVIDSDYRGNIMIGLYNDSQDIRRVESGDRIAQLIVEEYKQVEFEEVEELSATDRGDGGLGSTGTK